MRVTLTTPHDLAFADLSLDLPKREAICKNKRIVVKSTSFRLLTLLVSNGDHIVSRESIFRGVWGFHFDPGTKRIEVQLYYLRKVLRLLDSTTVIETHRGKGLRLYEVAK